MGKHIHKAMRRIPISKPVPHTHYICKCGAEVCDAKINYLCFDNGDE